MPKLRQNRKINAKYQVMKARFLLSCALGGLLFSSCGYHLGGLKPAYMNDMHTFCVEMFENNTLQPSVGVYMTTNMTNTLQTDGTYRLAPRNEADFVVKGVVKSIDRTSLTADTLDSYISSQIGVIVVVEYTVLDRKTGKVITSGVETADGAYYNQSGSTISAMDSALFYATNRAAEKIMLDITS